MACRNELWVDKLLVWNTNIPFEGQPRRSSNFTLMGSEYYLLFSFKKGSFFHVLTLHRATVENRPQQTKFSIKTGITRPRLSGDLQRDVRSATFQHPESILWYCESHDDIFENYSWLHKSGEMEFVCKFYGQPQSAFQLEIRALRYGNQSPDRTVEKSVQVSQDVPRDIESLSSDFSHLLEKEILADVKLECGGRTFQAHRSVLGARSEVFRAMFQNQTLESETGAVKVQDVDVAVLQKLLKFVYTGIPEDLSEDTTCDLYEAADKYAVLSLKTACAYWVVRNLTVENSVKYLRISDSHSDHDLKAAVISFITENPSVLKSEAWLALSKELPVLANEVFQTYVASTVQ